MTGPLLGKVHLKLTKEQDSAVQSSKTATMNVRSVHTMTYCDKCGVTFTTQHALLRHITSKHEDSPNSAVYCNICQRVFKTKWSRATHNSRYHRN
ncbi:hypothetical protein ALC57_03430 [Trachymyrmex cornetzi]|uniref:C2H2-type domain-containing protein n=1 Tax=Trachymyrmex cornetzi TaxID=471704 RepID=A0A195EGR8_9HYME|nr:hypothetical protein ALC57_03430 [Trachymyrmex cornetzi]